jgi:sugar phosphate isomerase/epimerase
MRKFQGLPSDRALKTRRQFVVTAGIGIVAAVSRVSATESIKPNNPSVNVGAHPWVYAATQPNNNITPRLPEIFSDMSYAGMSCIELMHTALRPDDAVSRIVALSRENSLPVVGASFDAPLWNREQHAKIWEDASVTIPRLAQVGGRTLGTSVGPIQWGKKIRKSAAQLDAQAEILRKIRALCESHGIVLNLHNHTYEIDNNEYDLKGTLARIPDVKLGPDLNWLVRAGVDPAEFIRRYRDRIVFLHLRDQNADGRWSEALGEGSTDFRSIGAALREINFSGDALIELAHEPDFKPTRPLRESLKLSRKFVRQTLGY